MLVLIWVATGRNPIMSLLRCIWNICTNWRFLLGFLIIIAMIVMNSYETAWENSHGQVVPWDLTEAMAAVGGVLVQWIQRLQHPVLTHSLTFIYIILLPVFGFASIIIYAARKDLDSFRRLVIGLTINYMVAVPFYLLMPVKEAWALGPEIQNLIPLVYERFEIDYRPMSGLTHCFPSLHTSLSMTCALVAGRSGDRRMAWVFGVGTGLVVFSTLYLGIHWPIDLVAGAVLALAATGYVPSLAAVREWVRRRTEELAPDQAAD